MSAPGHAPGTVMARHRPRDFYGAKEMRSEIEEIWGDGEVVTATRMLAGWPTKQGKVYAAIRYLVKHGKFKVVSRGQYRWANPEKPIVKYSFTLTDEDLTQLIAVLWEVKEGEAASIQQATLAHGFAAWLERHSTREPRNG